MPPFAVNEGMTVEISPHRQPCVEGDHCGELHCPPPAPRRRLTELEHDRAWHAVEGLDWETADPDTVLNAVLGALGIDPPASPTSTA